MERKIAFGGTLNRPVLPCEVAYFRERTDDKSTENKTKARERYRGRWEDLLSRTMRLVTDSVPFIFCLSPLFSLSLCPFLPPSLSLSFVALDTHVFSSCLPIENRVGDQIEFPTSTSFYSLRAGAIESGWGKNLTGFFRVRDACVRRTRSRSNTDITDRYQLA